MLEESEIKRASFESKEKFKLPKGAKIIKKTVAIKVEEIENGYLIVKSCDLKFKLDKETHYEYYTTKFYSKKNPMKIDTDNKMLADYFS